MAHHGYKTRDKIPEKILSTGILENTDRGYKYSPCAESVLIFNCDKETAKRMFWNHISKRFSHRPLSVKFFPVHNGLRYVVSHILMAKRKAPIIYDFLTND